MVEHFDNIEDEQSYKYVLSKAENAYNELVELYNYLQQSDYVENQGYDKFTKLVSETDKIIEHTAYLINECSCTYDEWKSKE